MAKYLKIDEILQKTGSVKETVKTASEKPIPAVHKNFDDFIQQTLEMDKEAGIASKAGGAIWDGVKWGWKKLFGTPSRAVTSVAAGTAGGFTGKHLYQTQQAKDAIKVMQQKIKSPEDFVRDPKVDSIRVELNKKYKDLEGSKYQTTPYGGLWLPKEYQ